MITLFGLIWLLILSILILFPVKYYFIVLLWSTIFQANAVFIIQGQDISALVITSVFFALRILLSNEVRTKYLSNKSSKILFLLFIYIIVVSIFSMLFFKGKTILTGNNDYYYTIYNGETGIYRFVVLFLLINDFILVKSIKKNIPEVFIFRHFIYIVIFVCAWGIIQFSFSIRQVIPNDLIMNLFYSNTLISNGFSTNTIWKRLFSTFQEPSYCSLFLVSSFWYIYIHQKGQLSIFKIVFLLVIAIEVVLTFSATSYSSFIFGFVVLTLYYGRKKRFILFSIYILLAILILLIDHIMGSKIIDLIVEKLNSASATTRGEWNLGAWNVFLDTYGIGIGYRVIRASSFALNMLGQIGIIGVLLLSAFFYSISRPLYYPNNKIKFSYIFLISIIIFGEIVACPDLDNCVLWMGIFMLGINNDSSKHIENSYIENYKKN